MSKIKENQELKEEAARQLGLTTKIGLADYIVFVGSQMVKVHLSVPQAKDVESAAQQLANARESFNSGRRKKPVASQNNELMISDEVSAKLQNKPKFPQAVNLSNGEFAVLQKPIDTSDKEPIKAQKDKSVSLHIDFSNLF